MKLRSLLPKAAFVACILGALTGLPAVHADIAIFQDGATTPFLGGTYTGTQDTMLYSNGGGYFNSTTDNRGIVPSFDVGNAGALGTDANRRAIIKFDISGLAGQYTTIDSVTLRLTASGNVGGSQTINVFRLTDANANWAEGSGSGGAAYGPEDAGGSTWAYKIQGTYPNEFSGTTWAGGGTTGSANGGAGVAGVDYINSSLASFIYNTTNGASGQTVDFVFNDVSFINQWITGINAGLILRQSVENTATQQLIGFNSREATTQSLRPQLIVNFTPTPEPGSSFLIACGLAVWIGRMRWRKV